MRRYDREVTDYNKMLDIMHRCDCCRLGFQDNDSVYIVPLNFGYQEKDEKLMLYFHSADTGKKIELISQGTARSAHCPYVKQIRAGFEMDTNHALVESDSACGYSYRYQSIIGKGSISMITEDSEKSSALQCIMSHYSQKNPPQEWQFHDELLSRVAVFCLEVEEWSCKAHE